MIIKIIEYNGITIDTGQVIKINPNIQIAAGLKSSYPSASLPAGDFDKLIIRQGNVWNEINKKDLETQIQIGYNELKPELKSTVDIIAVANIVEIDMSVAVAFQIDELQQDTNINFTNLQENKQVKLIVSGNVALTFTAENGVPVIIDNLSYNGASWNIVIAEVSRINSNLQINLISLQ